MKIALNQAAQMVADAQTVILTSHIRPDGDSIGSTLGLMHYLREQGKDARVLIDDEIPRIFRVLPGIEQIERPAEGTRYTADLLIVCDVELKRTGAVLDAVDAVRVIEGTQVVFFMKWLEQDTYRVSMRSKGTNVSRIAQGFGGGGHIRAAGCTLHGSFDEAKKTILEAIGEELNR